MASETQMRQPPFPAGDAWPPDDTEESILGTDLHQTTITNLRWGINEVARTHTAPGQDVPWQALSQIALLGCQRYDGSAYRTFPDVFVYPHHIGPERGSVTIAVDGPPVLVIEVLSEATYEADIDVVRGKGYSYARAGVCEYLTIDPMGSFIPERVQAWRLADGVYRPWEPEASGHWQSGQIAVAIGLEGVRASVYTAQGARQPREGEVAEELGRRDETIARQAAEIEELRQRDETIARQAAEIEELRQRDETIARQAAEIEELRRQLRELRGDR